MNKSIKFIGRVLVALLFAGLSLTGCYDDSGLYEKIGGLSDQLQDHESRIKELEALCKKQNTNIESLQTIVKALEDRDYVTNVAPITEGGNIIGYTITFSKSGSVTIYNGEDGYVPVLGVKQDTDGQWYWTIDGDWMTDIAGNKVRASAIDGEDGKPGQDGKDGITPKLKIEDDYWYVSYDNGQTWERYAPATGEKGDKGDQGQQGAQGPQGDKGEQGEKGDSMFEEVTYDADYVYITMADGEILILPRSYAGDGSGMVGPAIFSIEKVTATTAVFKGHVDLPKEDLAFCNVTLYYSQQEIFHIDDAIARSHHSFDENNDFVFELDYLTYNTDYHYCLCVEYRGQKYFSANILSFTTSDISIEINVDESSITHSGASVSCKVTGVSEEDVETARIEILYSADYTIISEDMWSCESVAIDELDSTGLFRCQLSLMPNKKYYYRYRLSKWIPNSHGAGGDYVYGEIKEFSTLKNPNASDLNVSSATDLSSSTTANCYIVSNAGLYKFKAVKGNSSESVGNVASVSILWETFGTDTAPEQLELIGGFCYKDGYIAFKTAETFKEGNAVIAAKDADGNILWSWHIWLTDQPEEQVYYNGAGTMMDRNLGATSATPGDVGARGLLYQWGRKDPFLSGGSISPSTVAKSTITWPSAVSTSSSSGTVSYVTANPTTFVYASSSPYDWHYSSRDNTLWTTSDKPKSIYDPCPSGWRVPDGGSNGVWSTALGSSSDFNDDSLYSSTNEGINFSGKFGSASTIWYPASGDRGNRDGSLGGVGGFGTYWSASPYYYAAYHLNFNYAGGVSPSIAFYRAYGYSVRCLQESK